MLTGTHHPWDEDTQAAGPTELGVHIKGIISVSPDSCIFPDTENCYVPQPEISGFFC